MDEKLETIQEEQSKALPMKWYKFDVNFLLIFSGVINIAGGLIAASCIMYSDMANFADIGFIEYYYTGNKVFDIICGVLLLILGAAELIVRSRMKKFTADALKKYYVLIIARQVFTYAYGIVFAFVTNTELNIISTVVVSFAVSLVCVMLEVYYFNKRKAMFVN
ncbi:MAG: hypothetical protein IIW48_04540 [Clostridia bacterium]|nr:hypothetical protein [Clostridia bacterium]